MPRKQRRNLRRGSGSRMPLPKSESHQREEVYPLVNSFINYFSTIEEEKRYGILVLVRDIMDSSVKNKSNCLHLNTKVTLVKDVFDLLMR